VRSRKAPSFYHGKREKNHPFVLLIAIDHHLSNAIHGALRMTEC
jgi:hypothetical protein